MKFYRLGDELNMRIFQICPKSFASNTYLLVAKSSSIIIDPSVSVDSITEKLKAEKVELKGILLTHGHFDHIISIDTIRERYNVPVYIHRNDACMLTDGHLNGFYLFFNRDCIHNPADILFEDGYEIQLDDETLTVFHTPGHSKGSCCFIFNDDKLGTSLLTGDTLFANSIGRCDLFGGSEAEIAKSIKKLSSFDRKSPIYPGHNESSSLGAALDNVAYFFDT